ncbi:sensor histidine kinase [Streptococcus macacae]|uniref:Histidine kinase n=1 Tax=Streptococcus macacae NCTC 11558 TaxID=764298 RepID=G5JWF7_9STRE|nr:sensor histidine kinase [Streptococcus macacae]EHJ52689.1 histidine kinase [Streptococcus macacae NCTC 11558]SUN77810.1 two-component sensor kinase [Streptococcus macacae NCTC 11558]
MRRYPLLLQLIVTVFLIILVLIITLGGLYYQTSSANIRQLIEKDTRQSIGQSGQAINTYLKHLKDTTDTLAKEQTVLAYAKNNQENDRRFVLRLMKTILSSNSDLKSAVLVTKSGQVVSTDPKLTMKTSNHMMEEKWYQNAIHQDAMPVVTPARQASASSADWVISVTQEVVDEQGRNLGVLRLDIGYTSLRASLDQLNLGKSGFAFIVNKQHEFVYHPQKSVYSSSQEMAAMKPYLKVKNGYSKTKHRFVYQKTIPNSQWTLVGVASLDQLQMVQQQIFWSFIGTGILAVIICGLAIFFATRLWLKPIRDLQKTILTIKNRDSSVRAKVTGSPELTVLAKQFNAMLDEIDQLMSSVAKKEQAIGQYRLQALASQINPHFLYNTLDTIIWMAEFNDNKRVVEVTKSLASYFRLALNQGNDLIALTDELQHVEQYLFIQKQRYGDKLSYKVSHLPMFDKVRIPKLILQPLAENAIYHGIKEVEGPGKIEIAVKQDSTFLILSVKDNGIGYDKEGKTSSQSPLKRGGIGLKNVDQRLKLQYGDDYHMTIQSKKNSFTEIMLYLPKNQLKED